MHFPDIDLFKFQHTLFDIEGIILNAVLFLQTIKKIWKGK
jgi:hypothetical protein